MSQLGVIHGSVAGFTTCQIHPQEFSPDLVKCRRGYGSQSRRLIQLAAFLAQRIGEAEPQLFSSLAADVLTDLRSLLRNRRPFFDQLLSSRLTKEDLHLADLVDCEIRSIDGRGL